MSLGLSRRIWVVQAGIFLSMLGYGAVFPFEIVYLHEARGFSLAVAQLPIVRARGSQPRRRAVARGRPLVVACLLALQGGFACLSAAATAFAVGECLHATAFMPLIADLAQLGLRGRYMATAGLSWWLGLAVAPTLGGPLLGMSASLPLIGGAVLAAAAIVLLRASEGALPVSARSIPQP